MPTPRSPGTTPAPLLARPAQASLWRRAGAFAIDFLLILLAALPIYLIPMLHYFQGVVWSIGHGFTPLSPLVSSWHNQYLASSLALTLLLALYFALCFARGGRTLGMRFAGIRVISATQQILPSTLSAFLRSLIFWLPFMIGAISFRPEAGVLLLALAALWTVVDRHHRLIPDIMARSQVIRELNQSPYLTTLVLSAGAALLVEVIVFVILLLPNSGACMYTAQACLVPLN